MIGLADPRGAAIYNFCATWRSKGAEGNSITEGIGHGRVTPIIADIRSTRRT